MGRDFKIGLISGLVLAVLALIWVATRPSLSTHARMLGPSTASSDEGLPPGIIGPAPDETTPEASIDSNAQPDDTLPPGLIAGEPTPSQSPFSKPVRNEEPDLTRYEQKEKITTTKFHIVRRGENLSAISKQYYGSPNKWRQIIEANPKTLKDPNKIAPGMKLIIPE